jgi:hypothetical protein
VSSSSLTTSHTLPGSQVVRTELGAADTLVLGVDLRPGLSQQGWRSMLLRWSRLEKIAPWRIGDLVFYGAGEYGAKYDDMAELTGLEYSTLTNYASVAGRFEIYRRRENLSFGHHAEVAYLGSDVEQDEWLDRAEREGLSVKQLRQELKERVLSEGVQANSVQESQSETLQAAPSESADLHPLTELETLRNTITTEHRGRWRPSAEAEGLSVGEWVVRVADEAAKVAA